MINFLCLIQTHAKGWNMHYIRKQRNVADGNEEFCWGRVNKLYYNKALAGGGITVINYEDIFEDLKNRYSRDTNPQEDDPTSSLSKAQRVRKVKAIWTEGGLPADIPWNCDLRDYLSRFHQVKDFLITNRYPMTWEETVDY